MFHTTIRSFTAAVLAASLVAGFFGFTPPIAFAAISNVSITPLDAAVNKTPAFDISFDTNVSTPASNFDIAFPTSFTVNGGTLGTLGSPTDVICSDGCNWNAFISIGEGDDTLIPVASVVHIATSTIRVSLSTAVNLASDTVHLRIKAGYIQNPSTAGTYSVTVRTQTDTSPVADSSVVITGDPDDFDHITVTASSTSITADETTELFASAYDSGNNLIGDVTASTTFEVASSSSGSITGGDTFEPYKTGSQTVIGTYAYESASSTVSITVSAGAPVDLAIMDDTSGNEDDSVDTDHYPGDTETYWANRVDQKGNVVDTVTVEWSFTGLTGIVLGDFATTSTTTTFTAHAVGEATINADYNENEHTATLDIEVTLPDCGEVNCDDYIDRIQISPTSTSITADDTQQFAAEAFDAFDNSLGDITASTTFSISEGAGGSFSTSTIGLYTAQHTGTFTVTASYTSSSTSETSTTSLTVTPGALHHFGVAASSSTPTTDDTFTVTLTAYDEDNNVKTDYIGDHSISWTYGGGAAGNSPAGNGSTKPGNGNQSFALGVAADITGFKITTTGTSTLSATDGSGSGTTTITVGAGALNDFVVTTSTTTPTTDDTFTVTLTARDAEQNTKTNYTGAHSVAWTYDGPASASSPAGNPAVKPADGDQNFSAGVASGIGTFKLVKVGTSTLTATADGESGTSTEITVDPGAIDSFGVSGITDPIVAGATSTVTVAAYDAEENLKTDYEGTIEFTSSDDDADLPGDYAFVGGDSGTHTFTGADAVAFYTSGEQSVTVNDSVLTSATGTQSDISVRHAGLDHLSIDVSTSSLEVGESRTATVSARDQYGNLVDDTSGATPYTGRVVVTTTAAAPYSIVPTVYTFDEEDDAQKTVSLVFFTTGDGRTITVTDLDNDELSTTSGAFDIVGEDWTPSDGLSVNSFEADRTHAVVGGTFANGFQWTFHITVPDDETQVQMKFGNLSNGDAGTIPANGNIRYYSAQSSGHGSGNPVVVSGTGYGTAMNITGDLDGGTPGRQIQIVVQVKVPGATPGGVYSGTYGIKSAEPEEV